MSSAHEPAADDVARMAVEGLRGGLGQRLVAVVLFGSQARGDASPASDWDLLVIAEGLAERPFVRRLRLKQLLPAACRGLVSLLARTPREFEANMPSLYLDIALDGRILYDPHGYAARRLAELQSVLARTGLHRQRTGSGDIWRWREPPSKPWALGWDMAHADQ